MSYYVYVCFCCINMVRSCVLADNLAEFVLLGLGWNVHTSSPHLSLPLSASLFALWLSSVFVDFVRDFFYSNLM